MKTTEELKADLASAREALSKIASLRIAKQQELNAALTAFNKRTEALRSAADARTAARLAYGETCGDAEWKSCQSAAQAFERASVDLSVADGALTSARYSLEEASNAEAAASAPLKEAELAIRLRSEEVHARESVARSLLINR